MGPRRIAALVAAGVLAAVTAGAPAGERAPAPRRLTILYTNDMHAQLEPIRAGWLPGSPRVGGMGALAGLERRLGAGRDDVLLVDSGDLLTGPAVSTYTRGAAPFDLLEAMGYDAMALGNHEFDYGVPRLEELVGGTRVPVLAANVFWRRSGRRFARPWVIVRRAGLRIGIVGVIGADAAEVTLPEHVRDLEFREPAEVLAALVPRLRQRVDLVVVLAHQGRTGPMQLDAEAHPELQRDVDADLRLAAAVPGIDVLVGGHAHRGLDPPLVEPTHGTIVVQTYGHTTTLGVLELEVDPGSGRVARFEGRLERVWSDRETPPPEVARRLAHWREVVARIAAEPVAEASAPIVRRYAGASPLGNLVTDLMRRATGAEVALYNAGGLRADLPAGTITRGDVTSALPFDNRLVVVRLRGAALRAALEQGLSEEHGMLQQSGMRVRYDPSAPPGRRLVSVTVGGAPLEDDREYTVATIDFLVQGGDGYRSLREARPVRRSTERLDELVVRWLRAAGRVTPVEDGRTAPVAARVRAAAAGGA